MNHSAISNLTIYRASAGSGKTYTLTKEYIKLLLKSTDYHRRILSVTFTNKATEEMKTRIVRELHRMSQGADEGYIREIAQETNMRAAELPQIAGKILYHLLHDYSHFSITTIDSFFQRVIRSFAREMGLFAGYDVELDQASVLDESIDLMMNEIDKNDFLKDWLVGWAEKKIEDGKSWNFKTDIHKLGHEIFSEKLQEMDAGLLHEITDKVRLEAFNVKLQKVMAAYNARLIEVGKQAMAIMNDYGLSVDDFLQKNKGVGGYFKKLSEGQCPNPNTYVADAINNIEGWHSKSSYRKDDIEQAFFNGLNDTLQDAYIYQEDSSRLISTVKEVLKQLNVLGVLSDLTRNINEYTRDQNLFMISEASGFLKTIIANADAPFIYERVGSFYNHFMIDEFQDTSAVQWGNFFPLISNSLASGNANWVVGDVKQSIYRWRNTDWKILSQQVEADLGSSYVDVKSLNQNWRSTPEVINFNNAFFLNAVTEMCRAFCDEEKEVIDKGYLSALTGQMRDAYRDAYQHLPEQKSGFDQGYVHLALVPDDGDEGDWKEQVLAQLPGRIAYLQDMGYRLSDIAILVRENKEAQLIADMLLAYSQTNSQSAYRYDVLSNESLLVKNAPSVKWLLAAMRFIVDPDDHVNRAYLEYEYQNYLGTAENRGTRHITATSAETLYHWRGLPVYELVDALLQEYGLYQKSGQGPFLQAFQDVLLQYTRREATDVRSFLDWWEEAKDKKYVTMPDNQDAIRLITIHKSKGLEFEIVIIPFCDWPLAKAGKMLWCEPQEEPFTDMKMLPMRFGPTLRSTIFVKEYLEEKMMSYIDNLNLLYVAFTRARKALFIAAPQPKKEGFNHVKDLLHHVFCMPGTGSEGMHPDATHISLNDFWQPDTCCFELGALTAVSATPSSEIVTERAAYFDMTYRYSLDYVPHIVRNYTYFATENTQGAQMDKGRILHDIFRTIITIKDLERCLNTLIVEGRLPESDRRHIVDMVQQALQNPIVSQWFAVGKRVKTETEILLPDGSSARPDRIVFDNSGVQVIDYKFGQVESGGYQHQVKRYSGYLRKMGYASVKGFLWYVTLNKVVEVN